MEKAVTNTNIAYQAEDGTVYVITPINAVAGILGVTGVSPTVKQDLAYIWEDCGVLKLILFVPAGQVEPIKAARAAGFKQEGRLKKAVEEGDLLVFGQYR